MYNTTIANCTRCGAELKPAYICLNCDIKPSLINKNSHLLDATVMLKVEDVINNMKKKIWSSLSEYLSDKNVPPERIQILNIMAENECQICDELLTEIKNNFSPNISTNK